MLNTPVSFPRPRQIYALTSWTDIEASARSFRGLIALAIARGGSYYLTHHKFAKPEQVMACNPQFKEFLDLKRKYDPPERFQNDWYRYDRKLFTS